MSEWMLWMLRVIGFGLAIAGMLVVYLAPRIVKKKNLAEKKKIDARIEENLTDEEKERYRRDGAILDVKLKGLLIALPGFAIILYLFA